MNVLGISGSPRMNGNSDILLEHALRPLTETGWTARHVRVRELSVSPCLGCEQCGPDGTCVIDDDMHIVYDAFAWCDALIVSTPVHWRNIGAGLMTVLERHHAVNAQRPLAGKAGGAIAVGRGEGAGQATALSALYTWMLSCGMIAVGGELNGVTAVAGEPGDVLSQPKRLGQAAILGRTVARVAAKLRE